MSPEPTLADLTAEADYAAQRLALYRQRVYAGKGTEKRLAELERIADGAARRLAAHTASAP